MGGKKDDAPPTVVFKFNWLCECQGCNTKIEKAVDGAEAFKVDWSAYELTVFGKVDSAKVLGNLKKVFKKKKVEIVPTQPKKEEVEIASPQPEKDAADGNNKPDDKPEKRADKEKSNDKKDQDKKAKEKKEAEIASPQPEKDAADGNNKPDDKPKKKADKEKSNDKKDEDKKAKETEWIKAKKELQEEKELSELLKPECDEIRQSAMKQVEEMKRELVNACTEIAKRKCAKLKSSLEEDKKLVGKLILEKDDEVQLAKRQVEEIEQQLAHAQKEAELARKYADAAENERTKVKEKEELIKLQKLETQEIRQVAVMISKELEEALNDADIAQNKLIKAEKDLQEKLEQTRMLKLKYQETKERAAKKELEFADILNAVLSASSSSSVSQACVICMTNEKNMVFGCGHMICAECGERLSQCPICRANISNRIKVYS